MKNRQLESFSPLINKVDSSLPYSNLILSSPTDIGVRRNGGRNGARFAPKAIINVLKKLNRHDFNNQIDYVQVTNQKEEELNFKQAQKKSAHKIKGELANNQLKRIVHIGGGHDHALPLLMAIESDPQIENILILNIDAHCDTRVDEIQHSGTPFRDFDKIAAKPFHLIQYGIHSFANSSSTMSPLKQGTMEIHTLDKILSSHSTSLTSILEISKNCPFKVTNKTAIFFSLDCDAISGEQMKAVSAVNPMGLPISKVNELLSSIEQFNGNKLFFGIYEYNPVYEDLSQLGSRGLANLIYNFLR